ncbi:protein YceI [mine drainage metagenome]|uniref:Protein YceI n=1 Tax=mine drainage metagenome TaxID=410659 RepID=A0A1J5RGB6_9ZZZZ
MNTAIKYLSSIAALILLAGSAGATEFRQVQPGESAVTFGFTQMGVPLEGKFNQFSAQIYFDPAKLDKAQARIEINVSSIDTGSAEGNEEVVGRKWFNAKDYPTASFVSTELKALGGNRYQATGKLSIKGRTLDVATPVTFQVNGTHGAFDGAFTIKRLDYMIGEGEWTDVSSVANEIQIKFHVVVNAAPSHK